MLKMSLRPDADGYNETEGEEVIYVALDGGGGRFRADKVGAVKTVNVKWTMNPNQYQYWRAFYTTGTKNGALPFLCDLISEDGTAPVEHVCTFVPGSVSKPGQHGLVYVQSATLEVIPNPRNEEADLSLIGLFGALGDESSAVLFDIEHLVNVTSPASLG